jgi:hypothetical protein
MRGFWTQVATQDWNLAPSSCGVALALAKSVSGCANWKSTSATAEMQ